ncbi:TPA: hypothetical protein EYN98_03690 [Candidatus Poribacteria bacterium]|nr:hypothetical protein [Candidatus Poribacteria bacterium]HIA65163.1 hypothetical protein [Candidatus Poribacteria bacterium]HIC03266.1 hypothetical protein [Candidatus Poribacteria bacterium]HIM10728.1 hypothetical protein [Candidatus Poribacteria bacterium]HIN29976.1 hypothetical protein [Candidatus Poribacteria bacterium]
MLHQFDALRYMIKQTYWIPIKHRLNRVMPHERSNCLIAADLWPQHWCRGSNLGKNGSIKTYN